MCKSDKCKTLIFGSVGYKNQNPFLSNQNLCLRLEKTFTSGGLGGVTGGFGTEGKVIFQLNNGFVIGAHFKKALHKSSPFSGVSYKTVNTENLMI